MAMSRNTRRWWHFARGLLSGPRPGIAAAPQGVWRGFPHHYQSSSSQESVRPARACSWVVQCGGHSVFINRLQPPFGLLYDTAAQISEYIGMRAYRLVMLWAGQLPRQTRTPRSVQWPTGLLQGTASLKVPDAPGLEPLKWADEAGAKGAWLPCDSATHATTPTVTQVAGLAQATM